MDKVKPSVTLSSTEAEYVALATGAQEVLFAQMLIEEIDAAVVKPAIIFEDNTGAIYLVNNQHIGSRTKHIDIRWHFLRDLVEEGKIMVKFIRSEDNPSDVMTKNVKESIHDEHTHNIHNGMLLLDCNREDVKQDRVAVVNCVESKESESTESEESDYHDSWDSHPVQGACLERKQRSILRYRILPAPTPR